MQSLLKLQMYAARKLKQVIFASRLMMQTAILDLNKPLPHVPRQVFAGLLAALTQKILLARKQDYAIQIIQKQLATITRGRLIFQILRALQAHNARKDAA